MSQMHRHTLLDASKITLTSELLEKRITERFPDSGLLQVVKTISMLSKQAEKEAMSLAEPIYWIRFLLLLFFGSLIATIFGLFGDVIFELKDTKFSKIEFNTIQDILQIFESSINNIVFIFIAFWSLINLEDKWKRNRAIKSLHRLRSLAHIVDMHQLTKDPEAVITSNYPETASSPKRIMTPFELTRYLDYCSEALSLLSKIAALHIQYFDDSQTLAAVSDVEILTDGLSRKIWQKINILDRFMMDHEEGKPTATEQYKNPSIEQALKPLKIN
jgi:hypothetical protein